MESFETPILSIVIPCYNCGDTLLSCVASISDDDRIEVVLIDDCSTDRTPILLKQYQKEMHRYSVVTASNSHNLGPGETRNTGIRLARGTYITFLDSDDILLPDACSILIEELLREDVDCLFFDALMEKGERVEHLSMFESAKMILHPVCREIALVFGRGCTWGKVYRRSVIADNKICFPSLPIGEDAAFSKKAFAHCARFGYLAKPLYLYKDNPSSLMHNRSLLNENAYSIIFNSVVESLEREQFNDELNNLYYQLVVYPTIITMLRKGYSTKECRKRYSELIKGYKCPDKYYPAMTVKYRLAYHLFNLNFFWVVRNALNNSW